ncbi:Soluble epoxide hydrolase [Alteripontixanthobacter maritimus]|uniref:Soluble epoxide hydrolase n=1 Tax=Alteripontixanthobacter maritimus TaxID=2161824 RepID=A0A369Q817_9SPHN|nr:alpha/beta hydrolase [Alteripontixanthobacter maritimus]RDC61033.1 Soluble epoxide hydrolase [Alteripontixanthobacter maritimus]
MTGPTSQTFFSQRLRLHYVDWGNADKPPLLLIHGGKDHCRSWDWTAEALSKDWHVIAMDHRGHGDSEWVTDGIYEAQDMVYDVAQLVHQLGLAPVTIIAHSLGGNVALRFAGIFPEQVRRIVAIEGLGPSPKTLEERQAKPYPDRAREWIEKKRKAAGRLTKRYVSLAEAQARMQEANSYLTDAQATHLTLHGVNRNEDGTFSWKFDPHLNVWPFEDTPRDTMHAIWGNIIAPALLLYGADSWASNPEGDGRMEHFNTAKVIEFDRAGHWLHHDRFDDFIDTVTDFI